MKINILGLAGALIFFIYTLISCGGGAKVHSASMPGDTLTAYSGLLTLIDHGNGTVTAIVDNPWNSELPPNVYTLVDRDSAANAEGFHNGDVILVPMQSALVYSSVHTTPLQELGAGEVIKGVADAEYFTSDFIKSGLNNGTIVNVGSALTPSLEAIVTLSPEVALISPYENSGHGLLDKSGTTVVDMADYMETTPLGRAEWLLLLGELTGKREEARRIFADVVSQYQLIKNKNKDENCRPLVVTEIPYNGVWYQPGGQSYMGTMIKDAGGRLLLEGEKDSDKGSVQLDIANVIELGSEADVWLIKATTDVSKADIRSAVPLASEIRAFGNDNVWVTNTSVVPLYDDLAFHPERVLADFYAIFNNSSSGTRYFRKLGS